MAENEDDLQNLHELFQQVCKAYTTIETTTDASSSDSFQSILSSSIKQCTKAIRMVNDLSLFSDNEELDELSSESIKYMVLPAFAGYFTCRRSSDDRKQTLESSKNYFMNFLKLCANYSMSQDNNESKSTDAGSIREQKIRRSKEKRNLEKRISELQEYVEKDHVDEEVKREFNISQGKRWILIAHEEIDSADRELEILEMMSKRGGPVPKPQSKPPPPFQPFILTRTRAQAQVYGAGYPSLATYSVEEFYEMQVKNAALPSVGQQQGNGEMSESDRVKEEEQEERDDPSYLEKKRNWDEFKDENRRGSGNRYNRG